MEKRTKGQQIEYAISTIFKAVSEYSFDEWLETFGISKEDWDKFMDAGKAALPKPDQVTNRDLIDFCNDMGGICKVERIVRITKNAIHTKLHTVIFHLQKTHFIQSVIQMK